MFSDHNASQLEMHKKKISRKTSYIWKVKRHFSIIQGQESNASGNWELTTWSQKHRIEKCAGNLFEKEKTENINEWSFQLEKLGKEQENKPREHRAEEVVIIRAEINTIFKIKSSRINKVKRCLEKDKTEAELGQSELRRKGTLTQHWKQNGCNYRSSKCLKLIRKLANWPYVSCGEYRDGWSPIAFREGPVASAAGAAMIACLLLAPWEPAQSPLVQKPTFSSDWHKWGHEGPAR